MIMIIISGNDDYLRIVQEIEFWPITEWYMSTDLVFRVFANGPRDRGSISARIIPKTQKMVLDSFLLNTQHYKVGVKRKVK